MTGYAHSGERVIGAPRGPAGIRAREKPLSGSDARPRRIEVVLGIGALVAILACALLVVLAAADRPSILAATTTPHFFPHWMAGPLGGLWPSLTRSTKALRYLFSGAIAVMYMSYLVGLKYVPRLSARWAIGAVIGAHLIMFSAPPLALTDIFNYVNYGRMEIVHHLNPYTTVPVLEPHSDPSYALSNWHQLLSPYGPVFTLMTFAVVPLGVAASFWTLKGLLMLANLGIVFLVWRSARLLGRDPVAAIVLVGLNPIVLIWGLGGDHNDFLMMFFVMLGFYLLLRAGTMPGALRNKVEQAEAALWSPALLGAGAAFVVAVAIKASAGILLPAVLAALLRRRRDLMQVVVGMAISAVVLGVCSVAAFGPHFPDLATQGRLVTMVSMPNLLGLALGLGGETESLRVVLSGVLLACVAACSVLAWRRRESLTWAGWASIALLVTLAWVLPWYVLWVLPLAALSTSHRLRTAALLLGVYFIIAWAPVTGYAFNAIGFHPEKTALGRLHQRYVKELLY
ncbi:MAG: hypothetical protein WBV85_02655 [Solirubrobacteraceae bacterium]